MLLAIIDHFLCFHISQNTDANATAAFAAAAERVGEI